MFALASTAAAASPLQFLEDNLQASGVRLLPSGLQYRVLKPPADASGERRCPLAESAVELHWEGYSATAYTDGGAPFYSTYGGDGPMPLTPVEGVSAWEEALQLMTVGEKWEVFAPAQLAYGDEGMEGVVGPGETLVYVLELASVEGETGPCPGVEAEVEAAAKALSEWHEGGMTRLRSRADYDAWVDEEGGGEGLVLALLRRPVAGVLLATFLAAAAEHAPRLAFGYAAESAYLPSELEAELELAAPALYVSRDGAASWSRCALLETPAWSHAPPTLPRPMTGDDGKPVAPSVALLAPVLEACLKGEGAKDEL